ncbi:hypothetical protein Z947_344 [Sulfitobacter geojensis]|nr:hypothetical protein Z947_344 [Sulfitobacter geojensis]
MDSKNERRMRQGNPKNQACVLAGRSDTVARIWKGAKP